MIHVLALLLTAVAHASNLGAIRLNNKGIDLLTQKQNYQAYQKFVDALAEAPFEASIHLNLGLTFELNEEYDKALKEYTLVAKAEGVNDETKFFAHFNAARVRAQLKDIPGALQDYQAALDIKSDSTEVKTNIELLWQGGGKGGNGGEDQKQQQDKKDQKNQQQSQQNNDPQQKQQPQKFDSKDLSQEDVRKILEELKNQEQQIRAEYEKRNSREVPRDKNW